MSEQAQTDRCTRCGQGWDNSVHGRGCALDLAAGLVAHARREALEEAAQIATPYHTSPDQPDGCLVMCSSCRTTRMIRDAIRALAAKEAPRE